MNTATGDVGDAQRPLVAKRETRNFSVPNKSCPNTYCCWRSQSAFLFDPLMKKKPNVWTLLDPTYPVELREFPKNNTEVREIWIYSDKMSYNQGGEVVFDAPTNADTYDLTIERDGGKTTKVHTRNWLDGVAQSTPDDAYVVGSDWKESYCFQVPKDWASGVYIVSVTPEIPDKGKAGKI